MSVILSSHAPSGSSSAIETLKRLELHELILEPITRINQGLPGIPWSDQRHGGYATTCPPSAHPGARPALHSACFVALVAMVTTKFVAPWWEMCC